jgi:hypothetical protein
VGFPIGLQVCLGLDLRGHKNLSFRALAFNLVKGEALPSWDTPHTPNSYLLQMDKTSLQPQFPLPSLFDETLGRIMVRKEKSDESQPFFPLLPSMD